MNKLLWLLIGAIITLLVPAVLSQPINEYFRGDRLVGTMKVADWQPEPVMQKREPTKAQSTEDIIKSAQQIAAEANDLASGNYARTKTTYAVLTLQNNSDKVVNNIRIKFQSNAADVLLDKPDDKDDVFQKDVDEITIPEMKQGDELTYRLWTSSNSPEYLREDVHTFSSTGPVRMRYVFPESDFETERSTFERVIDDWFPYIGLAMLLVFAGIMWALSSHYESLIKAMVKDQGLYAAERAKYEADPQKYNPATSNPKAKLP
jgi:hypothetical protein